MQCKQTREGEDKVLRFLERRTSTMTCRAGFVSATIISVVGNKKKKDERVKDQKTVDVDRLNQSLGGLD